MQTAFAQKLAALNLTAVMARLVEEQGLAPDQVLRAEQQYRDFLTLKAMHPGRQISPTKLADLVWHEHIIHTRQYMADCETLFGSYLHHTPTVHSAQYVEEVSALYQTTFGYNPSLHGATPAMLGLANCG